MEIQEKNGKQAWHVKHPHWTTFFCILAFFALCAIAVLNYVHTNKETQKPIDVYLGQMVTYSSGLQCCIDSFEQSENGLLVITLKIGNVSDDYKNLYPRTFKLCDGYTLNSFFTTDIPYGFEMIPKTAYTFSITFLPSSNTSMDNGRYYLEWQPYSENQPARFYFCYADGEPRNE